MLGWSGWPTQLEPCCDGWNKPCAYGALCMALQDKGGIVPALQRFSYAGKNLEDSQRTLEQ
jgi:hypothetical protein